VARAKVARGERVNESFWTTFAATLAGGAVSVVTAWEEIQHRPLVKLALWLERRIKD
jgi:hypothetical protein